MDEELVTDSLVYRYDPAASPDGLRGSEGTFSLCTFAYVDALARAGRVDDARTAFEKMLTYGNHVGLYSEEIALTGEQIGNFPQAFTHLSLIDAAVDPRRRAGPAAPHPRPDRPGREGPSMTSSRTDGISATEAAGAVVLPLALAQFVASYAGSNMNVAISTIAERPRHLGDRDPDHDHPVHADDGGADDPGQQADRHLGPQVLLHRWGSSSTGRAPCSPRSRRGCPS